MMIKTKFIGESYMYTCFIQQGIFIAVAIDFDIDTIWINDIALLNQTYDFIVFHFQLR